MIEEKEILISEHDYDELAEDDISVVDILSNITAAMLLEDYPDYHKGPCILVMQKDNQGNPIHVVWGIPKGRSTPAVPVTAYRPHPKKWADGFTRRLK